MTMSAVKQTSDLQLKMSGLLIHDEKHEIVKQDNLEENQRKISEQSTASEKETESDIERVLKNVCVHFVEDLNKFGIAVIDSFLGNEKGDLVYEEVINLHRAGIFTDGQLVRNDTKNKDIRGDEIIWLVGNESLCPNIRGLINDIDQIVITANKKLPNNGELGKYKINGRTKAMVACYPGNGAHYVKHVDNPNKDGRVLTAIYYLNKNWDSKIHGGMLRIFPSEECPKAAEIEPKFDRMLFFWSDRRNPHEVQPSFRTRFAITIWYFDATEKARASRKLETDSDESYEKKTKMAPDEKEKSPYDIKHKILESQ